MFSINVDTVLYVMKCIILSKRYIYSYTVERNGFLNTKVEWLWDEYMDAVDKTLVL